MPEFPSRFRNATLSTGGDYGFTLWAARQRVGPGQTARERLRAFCREHGADIAQLTGESEEDWALGTKLAQAYLDEHKPLAERGEYRCDGCGAVTPYGGDAQTNGAHGECGGRWRAFDK